MHKEIYKAWFNFIFKENGHKITITSPSLWKENPNSNLEVLCWYYGMVDQFCLSAKIVIQRNEMGMKR